MGVFFVKKWKMGVAFVKKVDLSSTQGALSTVSVFFILHFYRPGGVRAWGSNSPINTSEGEQRSTKCSWYGIS